MAIKSVIDRDLGWKAIQAQVARARSLEVAVGILTGSKNPEDGANIAEYAAYNEYGTKHIPARPFMAISFDENVDAIGKDFDQQGGLLITGKRSAEQALTIIGMKHAQRIQNTITGRNIPPPLAESTVARKKNNSTKTLVDTGAMVNAVQIDVRAKGTEI
jgi:hypothetical protein